MYLKDEMVLYSTYGVCRIAEIAEKDMGGSLRRYYVLKPLRSGDATIFVPSDNESLTSKIRRVMSEDEARSLIDAMPDEGTIWMEDEQARRDRYREILSSGSRKELVRLIKTLYLHKQSQKGRGKKMKSPDEDILKSAEKMLHDEFAYVFNIKREEVLPLIVGRLEPLEDVRK
jgi:CarD family transcriptional regulator